MYYILYSLYYRIALCNYLINDIYYIIYTLCGSYVALYTYTYYVENVHKNNAWHMKFTKVNAY